MLSSITVANLVVSIVCLTPAIGLGEPLQTSVNEASPVQRLRHQIEIQNPGNSWSSPRSEELSTDREPQPTSDLPPKPRPRNATRPAKQVRVKFQKKSGVVYKQTEEYELKCDLYIPEGEGPFPAIVAIHGGAWRQGTKLTMLRHAWRMAGSGYVVVAINYRHAPRYPFPAQVHDCKHAIRWMRAEAKELKIDTSKIGAFGYSAGGHLAAMLGTSDSSDGLEGPIDPPHRRVSSRVQAVAAGGAPCDFSWLGDDSNVLSYWLGGSRSDQPETYRAASPVTYISPDDPPFYFFHGGADLLVPVESSQKLHQALLRSNVASQHAIAKRSGHLGTFSDLDWMDRSIEFFDKHLKKATTEPLKQPSSKIESVTPNVFHPLNRPVRENKTDAST